MQKGKRNLADKLIDSIYYSATRDKSFLKDDPRLLDQDIIAKIENTAQKIERAVGAIKIEEGIQKGKKIERVLYRLKEIGQEKVTTLVQSLAPNTDTQLVIQFYRKLDGSTTDSSLEEDALYLNILENIDEIEEQLPIDETDS